MSYVKTKLEQCKADNKTVTLYLEAGHKLGIRITDISADDFVVGRNQEFDNIVVPFSSIKAITY